MDGLLGMFAKSGDGEGGGIMGMVRKFDKSIEEAQRAGAESVAIQRAILAELQGIRVALDMTKLKQSIPAGETSHGT